MKKKRHPFQQTLFQGLQFFLTTEDEVRHLCRSIHEATKKAQQPYNSSANSMYDHHRAMGISQNAF
jgi:hypothetical protein